MEREIDVVEVQRNDSGQTINVVVIVDGLRIEYGWNGSKPVELGRKSLDHVMGEDSMHLPDYLYCQLKRIIEAIFASKREDVQPYRPVDLKGKQLTLIG